MKNGYLVAMLGARMHYAVPRVLHDSGLLSHFCSDFCASKGWLWLAGILPACVMPKFFKRFISRIPYGVPAEKITSFSALGLQYRQRLKNANSLDDKRNAFLWAGKEFSVQVKKHGLGNAAGVYVLNSAGLELLEFAKDSDLKTVLEQCSCPREIEQGIVQQEVLSYPAWENMPEAQGSDSLYAEREREEWQHADLIICPSEFVRDGVALAGGPVERCCIVPYGVNLSLGAVKQPEGRLKVLTVGKRSLQKGSQYVLAAAEQLKGRAEFRMVGSSQLTLYAEEKIRLSIDVHGPVPRGDIHSHYEWADVFLLPSLSEGSATVCYEALAAGLPVICTPNTGSVVRNGVDGFVVPIRDATVIAEKIEQLSVDRGLLKEMSENALKRSREFTIEKYGERLTAALNS